MNMQSAVQTVLKKYAVFSGRAPRSEYWYWVLALVLVSIGVTLVDGAIVAPMLGFERFSEDAGQPLEMLFTLAIFLPALGVSIRRLHDTDHSGWWILLGLIPIVGTLILLWWYTRPSDEGDNQYGPPALSV